MAYRNWFESYCEKYEPPKRRPATTEAPKNKTKAKEDDKEQLPKAA